MHRSRLAHRASRVLVCGLLPAALTACCSWPAATAVPAALAVPPDQKLLLSAEARGVQIYKCLADKNDATRFVWTFAAPEAVLFDRHGVNIGKHYAGPTWESTDGSTVVGAVAARDDGPNADAIPWLLLNVKSSSGSGVLSNTKSIQRINTAGGKAPGEGCDASHADAVARIPYSATYRFYGGATQ